MSIKVLATAYFSRHDTRTPVRYAVISMVSNMVFNLLLIIPLAHVGLALATSISAFVNGGLLLYGLLKAQVFSFRAHWIIYLFQAGVANLVMVLVLNFFLSDSSPEFWFAADSWSRVLNLGILCIAGVCSYSLTLLLCGVRPSHFRHSA